MTVTGLKLSCLALSAGELSTLSSLPDLWVKLGVGGMSILGLIYIYNDMRKVHKEKEAILISQAQDMKKVMNEHKNDVQLIVKDQIKAAADIAKIAAELSAASNEVLRDNVQIMIEVKDVIKANTAAVVWCRDSAIARAK